MEECQKKKGKGYYTLCLITLTEETHTTLSAEQYRTKDQKSMREEKIWIFFWVKNRKTQTMGGRKEVLIVPRGINTYWKRVGWKGERVQNPKQVWADLKEEVYNTAPSRIWSWGRTTCERLRGINIKGHTNQNETSHTRKKELFQISDKGQKKP